MGLDKYMRGNALIHLLGANHGKFKRQYTTQLISF